MSANAAPLGARRRPYKLLGIVGSLRADAFSKSLLEAVAAASAARAEYEYADIGLLPHFNQDLYVEPLPESVSHFRHQIAQADGLVISSPEYNHGMPGVLKTALEWASRPHNASPLKGKPVLIFTSSVASTGGVRAQYQIRETLASALAHATITPEIVVGSVGAKVVGNRFQDPATIAFAMDGLAALLRDVTRLMDENNGAERLLAPAPVA